MIALLDAPCLNKKDELISESQVSEMLKEGRMKPKRKKGLNLGRGELISVKEEDELSAVTHE